MLPELTGPILRGLGAALGYVALTMLGARLRRIFVPVSASEAELTKNVERSPQRAPFYVRAIELAAGLVYAYAMLVWGWLSPQDMSLSRPVPGQMPLAVAAILVAPLWLILGEHVSRGGRVVTCTRRAWPSLIVMILQGQVGLVILQGAAIPLVGRYWGLFAGLAWHAALVLTRSKLEIIPSGRATLSQRIDDLSLDWVSTLLVALTSSLWVAAGARVFCGLVVSALKRGRLALGADAVLPPDLAEDQGERDQQGKHAGGEEADALEVA